MAHQRHQLTAMMIVPRVVSDGVLGSVAVLAGTSSSL
jgi:hypothetical protein